MRFWKMNGAGNDFILISDLERVLPDTQLPALARRACERRLGVGADGLMVVRPAEADGDFRMLFFNADGSVGEMCGNGARCVCRYACETGIAAGETQRVETTAGPVTGYRVDERTWRVRLNDPEEVVLHRAMEVEGETYDCAYAVVGVPHAVLRLPHLRETPPEALLPLARALRYHPAFPKGANVNFYEIEAPGRIFLRTYERGVEDFTYACGTGTGATVFLLTQLGLLPGRADAEMRGGTLHVDVDMEGGTLKNLWLTGPADVAAKGELIL